MDAPQHRQWHSRPRIGIYWGFLALLAFFLTPAFPAAADAPSNSLSLSSDQQQKVESLESASRSESAQLLGQIDQLRRKLSDLYSSYSIDVNAARKTNQDLNRVQGQLLDLRLNEQMQLRGILTADQFAQLQATMHPHGFPGGHGPHGPDPNHGGHGGNGPHGWHFH